MPRLKYFFSRPTIYWSLLDLLLASICSYCNLSLQICCSTTTLMKKFYVLRRTVVEFLRFFLCRMSAQWYSSYIVIHMYSSMFLFYRMIDYINGHNLSADYHLEDLIIGREKIRSHHIFSDLRFILRSVLLKTFNVFFIFSFRPESSSEQRSHVGM